MLEKLKKGFLILSGVVLVILFILSFGLGLCDILGSQTVEASDQKSNQMERLIRAEEQQAQALQDILRELRNVRRR